MKTITLNSTVSLHPGNDTVNVDDAVVIGRESIGEFYGVESIARRIWELLADGGKVADLCETLLKEYAVDRETCERDVLDFLNDAMSQGLIRSLPPQRQA